MPTPSGGYESRSTLRNWQRLERHALGRWLFARMVCLRAPYFATISPRVHALQPGLCTVAMARRRSVQNHIGSVHAIAMANLVELAVGLAAEASVPAQMRWIPRGMQIDYLARAGSDVRATARLEHAFGTEAADIPVPVEVTDASGAMVVRAIVTLYVSARPRRS